MMLAVLAVLFVPAVGAPASAQTDAATDQRVVSLVATYDIQPDEGVVEVVEQITVRNVKGNTRSGNTVTQFFWTGHEIWAPADAEDLSISVGGEELEWEIFDTVSGVLLIDAFYRSNLNFGQTRVIDVTYTLPTYPPGDGVRRINGALFDLALLVCCNFEEVELVVTAPESFVVLGPTNLDFTPGSEGGRQTFTYADDEVTGQFTEVLFTDWFGFDDAGLERSSPAVGTGSAELVYPPDDGGWATETTELLEGSGAELERLLGSPLPAADLVLQQGRNDEIGPAGVPGPYDEPLSLPRDATDQQVAATLAGVWLADAGLADERIEVGLAAALGLAAAEAAGGDVEPPREAASSPTDDERALAVMHDIADEIGPEGLGRVAQQLRTDEGAYEAEGGPAATATIPADWRRFLDLAERGNGSSTAADLLADHLLTDDEVAQLARRTDTLAEFDRLASQADGVMPVGIRTAMTNWAFDDADALLTVADEVIAERDRIVGDDPGRAGDEGLVLGETWAAAESAADLEAVQAGLLDRERALGRARLIQYLGVFLVLLALVGGVLLFVLLRRRSATPAVAPFGSPDRPGDASVHAMAPPVDPVAPGGAGPVAPTLGPPVDPAAPTLAVSPPPAASPSPAADGLTP
ncbi:MAG: hypothetical protein AAFN30_09725, partial [Actinomycetota bacterium]